MEVVKFFVLLPLFHQFVPVAEISVICACYARLSDPVGLFIYITTKLLSLLSADWFFMSDLCAFA